MKIKFVILLLFLSTYSYSQIELGTKHVYALNRNYNYLQLVTDSTLLLEIGMYGRYEVEGNYNINTDTLVINKFSKISKKLSEFESNWIQNNLRKFKVQDSILIPIGISKYHRNRYIKRNADSILISNYLSSDGHVFYSLKLNSNNSFKFLTGASKCCSGGNGKFQIIEKKLLLKPDSIIQPLDWISTNTSFVFLDSVIVGMTFNKENLIKEYHYLYQKKQNQQLTPHKPNAAN